MTAITRSRRHPVKHSLPDRIFLTVNFLLLTLFFIIILYPLLFVVVSSVSASGEALSLNLIPKTVSTEGYKAVFEYKWFWVGYGNSLLYAVLGTAISVIVTICCAYPLSRSDFKAGGVMMALCMFTMYFQGGLIPGYLNLRDLKMLDTIWAIVLPGALSIYNMIVMRTFFKTSIPNELREAAYLDGCGDMRYLLQIVLPLSGSIIAVISLYVAVAQWNNYFAPMVYLNKRELEPLSMVLRELLVLNTVDHMSMASDPQLMADMERRQQVMKYAVIVVASLPVMMIYPFVQKYFVKGVMIGSVKG